ncbi:hypothetical protein SAMN04488700_0904 [Carnobacterium iners]|uniref:Uncharacterized protein n=1 Tax=Carnobacterium iners TaxID=1073423 RepID=A0A1X7MVJ2_9LACT|nr:hypothetical protein [Carnobacterium iners]SEK55213.1 hypothetical protein SAMN04488114_1066 [Carnobacterium iners]SMH28403.1 hypothetical protein SAMN04488700_0904 [Carnobacterium iners]
MTIINGLLVATMALVSGIGLSFHSGMETLNQKPINQEQEIRGNNATTMMETNDLERMEIVMENEGIKFNEMQKFMEEDNSNFEQIKSYMNEMHANLTNSERKEFYKGMHETDDLSRNSHFRMREGRN